MKKIITYYISAIGDLFHKKRLFAFTICLLLATFNGFTQAPDTWTQKADFGGMERYGAVGFSIGNKGYIGTGFRGGPILPNFNNFKDFWEYDPRQ